MGRATSGVIGMRFIEGDELLGLYVVHEAEDVLVATEVGYDKRTPADQYPLRNRGGLGVITAQITEGRGDLVGALMVGPDDEVFAITSAGGVIRTRASEVRQTGRVTMGVRLMNLASGDTVVALARNPESESADVEAPDDAIAEDGLPDEDGVADSNAVDPENADFDDDVSDGGNETGSDGV
jgi:DNA gyrase subunit A